MGLFAEATGIAYGVDSSCHEPSGSTCACNRRHPSALDTKPVEEGVSVTSTRRAGCTWRNHGAQVACKPFERLNLSALQNAAALRYQHW